MLGRMRANDAVCSGASRVPCPNNRRKIHPTRAHPIRIRPVGLQPNMFWRRKKLVEQSKYLVECIGVEKTYQSGAGPVRVLKGIDLDVEPGQLIGLYGPSGSGKTTLLNLVGALDTPTAGQL